MNRLTLRGWGRSSPSSLFVSFLKLPFSLVVDEVIRYILMHRAHDNIKLKLSRQWWTLTPKPTSSSVVEIDEDAMIALFSFIIYLAFTFSRERESTRPLFMVWSNSKREFVCSVHNHFVPTKTNTKNKLIISWNDDAYLALYSRCMYVVVGDRLNVATTHTWNITTRHERVWLTPFLMVIHIIALDIVTATAATATATVRMRMREENR